MPLDKSIHFKIIVPMYNCEKWAVECLQSVLSQTYKNWQIVVAVEPSEDNTYEVVREHLEGHQNEDWILTLGNTRKYVPLNHVESILRCSPSNDDVIVLLDGDDMLHGANVLSYLAEVYQDENVWITWGSYVVNTTKQRGMASQPVPKPNEDPYRGKRWWRFSHLKTFRYFLFKGIQYEDLRSLETGEYYHVAGDMALMFPMVEMAGPEHSKYIEKILYIYNRVSPYNDDKLYNALCKRTDLEIRNRPQYSPKTKDHLCRL